MNSKNNKHAKKKLINDFKACLTIDCEYTESRGHQILWHIVKPENYMEKYDINELTAFLDVFPWV